MARTKETSTKQWVQEGPYPPPPDDEDKAIQDDISFQVRWNTLVGHHRATRHMLQNIENEMWEMQYSRQEMLTEGPSAHRPQSPTPEYSTADARAIRERMLELEKEAKQLGILDKGKAELRDIDPEPEEEKRRREQREAQNIWARFDRHSLPRHK
ncbi:hypothetical protein CEP54_006483 [Fusarium duplospermum]|uniref:Uncharacterized protein n=1 Tax=Fusarium duplospermum TaxID=1325734 RepID=A0A428Q6Y2_9HYPO|nr:hypothetical protein CEP54_006483 [Fusarium duplospermum]